jgi:hypothetical protein
VALKISYLFFRWYVDLRDSGRGDSGLGSHAAVPARTAIATHIASISSSFVASGDRDPRYVLCLRDMRDGEGDKLLGLGRQGTIDQHSSGHRNPPDLVSKVNPSLLDRAHGRDSSALIASALS